MALVHEKPPPESNWFVTMLTQLLKGVVTLVAVNTAYGALGGPPVPERITFVPNSLILENFGGDTPTTSIEPSTRSLLVQSSPALSGGNEIGANDPANTPALNSLKRLLVVSAVGPMLVTVSAPP